MFHVVDDDIIILELLKEIIVSADYDVLCFESGEHYLNHLNSAEYQNPIAVLSDVNMPGITGHAMALQVRHQHPRQKIVFITGKPDVTHHRFSTKLQCYTMDKPFHPERLIALLKVLSACEQSCSAQAASDDNTSSESSSYSGSSLDLPLCPSSFIGHPHTIQIIKTMDSHLHGNDER